MMDTQEVMKDMDALKKAKSTLPADDFSVNETVVGAFIEEAVTVLQALDLALPQWKANPNDLSFLVDTKHGFYTLKNSARKVGANNVGEMAWSIEHLLNRLLNNSLAATDKIIDFVDESKLKIAQAIADFQLKQPPSNDPTLTIAQANKFLAATSELKKVSTAKTDIDTVVVNTDMQDDVKKNKNNLADSSTNQVDDGKNTSNNEKNSKDECNSVQDLTSSESDSKIEPKQAKTISFILAIIALIIITCLVLSLY